MEVKKEKPTPEKLRELDIKTWSPWEHGVDTFDWEYDSTETFYVLEGRVKVVTEDGQVIEFEKGDLVTFPRGTKCTWEVVEPIRKVYRFE